MRALFVVAAVICASLAVAAPPEDDLWAEIVAAHVNAVGEVTYRSLARRDRDHLAQVLDRLKTADAVHFDHDHAVSFWLNAYHAMVIAAVLHGERPETVASRARMYHWFGLPIAGSRHTLDAVRTILNRYASADPRIHLAICDGTRGGPRMPREPYDPDRLDAQLAAAARAFIDDPEKNRVAVSTHVEASRLFDWYRRDFEHEAGSLAGFLRSRATNPELRRALDAEAPLIDFAAYDWSLNAAANEQAK
jgi:Protein of unknown function, DUF547